MNRTGGAGPQRGALRLQRFASAEAFLDVAHDFLADREAEHNLIFGITHNMLTAPEIFPNPPYLAVVVDADGIVVAAALQTPPWQLVLSETDTPAAIDLILEDRLGDPPPGVLGPAPLSARFASAWTDRTGSPAALHTRERILRLERVLPPRRTTGGMRAARPSDRGLLVQWLAEFSDEALGGELIGDVGVIADRWASGVGRTMQLWIDNGHPVSMAGVAGPTPHGIRIGPVYTPADVRERGYASNLVARACAAEIDAGRRYCFLFTDLANPTSNHIYESIGFEPVTDVDRWVFG